VSDLPELLRLLHDGPPQDARIRMVLDVWHDDERAHEAMRAEAQGSGGTFFTVGLPADGDEEDDEDDEDAGGGRREEVRVWFDGRARVRVERRDGLGRPQVAVRDGRRWWMTDGPDRVITNARDDGDEEVGSDVGEELREHVEPWRVLGALRLAATGAAVVGGRPALLAAGAPRPAREGEGLSWTLRTAGWGADAVELAVDREHGVLLRLASLRDGLPFRVAEVRELAVGEPFGDALFAFAPAQGTQVRGVLDGPRHQHDLRPHELARLAPFAVFLPDRIAPGWRVEHAFTHTSEEHGTPPSALVHLSSDDGRYQVSLNQSPAGAAVDEPRDTLDVPSAWRTVEHGGRTLDVREPAERWAPTIVRAVREGTLVQVVSQDMELDALLDLAAGLVRAPDAPPPLRTP